MNIKTELIKEHIVDTINKQIEDFDIDADEIADTVATNMLAEIQKIIKNNNYSYCEIVEEIVMVFEKYKIDFGNCHDF